MINYINYLFFIFFALAPSLIWLLFFLRKDSHAESNKMVLKVFLYGMLAALPAVLIELGFKAQIDDFILPKILVSVLYVFIGIALVEEVFKYLVVKTQVLKNPEFDEPVDIMLYMIISALGFAALENVFILSPFAQPFQLLESFTVSVFRFVGATFLHALCSGLLGYFLALSFLHAKNRLKLKTIGLTLAVLLHGFYDFSIIKMGGNFKFVIPAIILISLIIFVSWGFQKVKKLKSISLPHWQANK